MILHLIEYCLDVCFGNKNDKEGQINDQCCFIYFIFCFSDPGCADCTLPGSVLLYVRSFIREPHLPSLQQICIQESVNSFFLRFRSFCTVRKYHGKSRNFTQTDRFCRYLCRTQKKGGIAIVCVIVSCFFGAISGSGPATVAALGAVLIPAMVEQGGFSAPFSTALMATSSSVAIVIPPSIAFVVYASITGVSIADMFMAGIVPGILMGVALVIVVILEANKHDIKPSRKKASAKERWATFKEAFWGFPDACHHPWRNLRWYLYTNQKLRQYLLYMDFCRYGDLP